MSIPVHVALVDETGTINPSELGRVAGALNEQILHDFAPVWRVRASVGAYRAEDVPPHTWAIRIRRELDEPGALGYHTDDQNQPVSYVALTPDWSVTASHELLEMLADPWGNRMHAARLPLNVEDFEHFGLAHVSSRVHYLVEVCDPPEAVSYEIGGVDVSDFISHYWYRTNPPALGCYSHAGTCAQPRQVARGGYVSFCNQEGDWFQVFNWTGKLQVKDLGRFDRAEFGSLRAFTDHHARDFRANHDTEA